MSYICSKPVLSKATAWAPAKGNPPVALDGFRQYRTFGAFDYQLMEAGVEGRVLPLIAFLQMAFFSRSRRLLRGSRAVHAAGSSTYPARRAAGGEALQKTAQIEGIHDVRRGESANDEAAGDMLQQQTFLSQQRQRLTYRRSRHSEKFGEGRLGHALSRRELAPQYHLPDAHRGLVKLSIHRRPQNQYYYRRGSCG